jgi:hypothetical protein
MTVLKIASNQMQSTLSILKLFGDLAEKDTKTDFHLQEESSTDESEDVMYILHPMTQKLVEIDPEQRWFWTEEWQIGERQVEQDLAAGDYEDFENMDDFFADM